jgi:hypothetical protein
MIYKEAYDSILSVLEKLFTCENCTEDIWDFIVTHEGFSYKVCILDKGFYTRSSLQESLRNVTVDDNYCMVFIPYFIDLADDRILKFLFRINDSKFGKGKHGFFNDHVFPIDFNEGGNDLLVRNLTDLCEGGCEDIAVDVAKSLFDSNLDVDLKKSNMYIINYLQSTFHEKHPLTFAEGRFPAILEKSFYDGTEDFCSGCAMQLLDDMVADINSDWNRNQTQVLDRAILLASMLGNVAKHNPDLDHEQQTELLPISGRKTPTIH